MKNGRVRSMLAAAEFPPVLPPPPQESLRTPQTARAVFGVETGNGRPALAQRPSVAFLPAPWDVRLVAWGGRQLIRGRLVVRFLAWLGNWYIKGRAFLWHHMGGRVKESVYLARSATCESCPHMRRVEGVRGRDDRFCHGGANGGCGCGTHRCAALSNKLRLKRFSCPVGKF